MTIPKAFILPIIGLCLITGVIIGFVASKGPTEEIGEKIVKIDTVKVFVHDTLREVDTVTITKPEYKYRLREKTDTVYIEKVREYATTNTFKDSAWVKHIWDINDKYDALNHRWDYRPPPMQRIMVKKEIKVFPSRVERVAKTVGAVAFGAGLTAIVNNNR